MAQRAGWQTLYAIEQTAGLTNFPKFYRGAAGAPGYASSKGILGTGTDTTDGIFLLDVTGGQPHLAPTTATKDTERTVGISSRYTMEFDQTAASAPTVTIETPADAYKLSLFLWLLMQNGASEVDNGTTRTAIYVPYTSPDTEIYAALVRCMVDSSTIKNVDHSSHLLTGCICSDITLKSEEGGLLTLTATFIGAAWYRYNVLGYISNSPRLKRYPITTGSPVTVKRWDGAAWTLIEIAAEVATDSLFTTLLAGNVEWSLATGNFNFAAADITSYAGQWITVEINDIKNDGDDLAWSNMGGFALQTPLKWQNATIYLNGTLINLPGISLSLKNNTASKFYDSDAIQKFVLGRFNAEGEIRIPWGTTTEGGNTALLDFIGGTTAYLTVYWGTPITGTCTAGGSATTLVDSAALFTTTGKVYVGDIAINTVDKSYATVVSIDLATQLTTTALVGGTTNVWTSTNTYVIVKADTDGDFFFSSPVRHKTTDVSGDVEIETGAGFSSVYDGTNSIKLKCSYAESKLIRGIT